MGIMQIEFDVVYENRSYNMTNTKVVRQVSPLQNTCGRRSVPRYETMSPLCSRKCLFIILKSIASYLHLVTSHHSLPLIPSSLRALRIRQELVLL